MALPKTAAEMVAKQLPQGAVDPNVKIPRAVIEAGKRSEEIQRQITGQAEPSVLAQPEATNGVTLPGNQPDEKPPEAPVEQPPVEQAPTPPVQEPPPAQQGQPDWERQFKSLQGRYESDIKRGREAITQLSERLDAVMRENEAMRAGTPKSSTEPNGASTLTEQEISDYGPEFVDVMRRVVGEATAPLHDEIANLKGQLGHVQQETGNAFLTRMNATIGATIPNWSDLNRDPRFIQWSELPDVFSGAIRKQLMQDAWNSGDARRVTAFFQAFLAEEAATNPQRVTEQRTLPPSRMVVSDTPVSPVSPPTPGTPFDLSALAAPGRAHSAGGVPAEKPVYTSADITRFYTDVASGRWRGREREQAAIDQDIMMAQREGRIIPDPRNMLPRDPHGR